MFMRNNKIIKKYSSLDYFNGKPRKCVGIMNFSLKFSFLIITNGNGTYQVLQSGDYRDWTNGCQFTSVIFL